MVICRNRSVCMGTLTSAGFSIVIVWSVGSESSSSPSFHGINFPVSETYSRRYQIPWYLVSFRLWTYHRCPQYYCLSQRSYGQPILQLFLPRWGQLFHEQILSQTKLARYSLPPWTFLSRLTAVIGIVAVLGSANVLRSCMALVCK